MSTPEKKDADAELADLIGSLDAEFGKKKRGAIRAEPKRPAGKASPDEQRYHSYAKAQLEFLRGDPNAREIAPGEIGATWIPEARLTYVITQHCRGCGDKVTFIGGEYIRFRGRGITFRDLSGIERTTRPSIIRRAEVCPDLWHFNPANGEPLPDLVDYHSQEVARCAGCIQLEEKALEIWNAAVESGQAKQDELDLSDLDIEGR